MSRRLFAFLLSELTTLRVICKSPVCGAITELSPRLLEAMCVRGECPVCKAPFGLPAGQIDAISKLAKAIQSVQACSDKVDIEFIQPDTSGGN